MGEKELRMDDFEQAFSGTEEAASTALKSATGLATQIRALQKAAKEGNINAIKRASARIQTALGSLRQEVANAVEVWPYTDEEEVSYLKERYAAELVQSAAEKGLDIHKRGESLLAHPSVIRIIPGRPGGKDR